MVHLYDLLYIIDSTLEESSRERLANDMRSIITKNGGEIVRESSWGNRKLAYEIRKKTEGAYINIEFRATPAVPDLMQEFVSTHQGIIRHLVIKVPKAKFEQDRRDQDRLQKQMAAAEQERQEIAKRQERAQAAEAQRAAEAAKPETPAPAETPAAPAPEGGETQE